VSFVSTIVRREIHIMYQFLHHLLKITLIWLTIN